MANSKLGKVSLIIGITHAVAFFLILIISTINIAHSSIEEAEVLTLIAGGTVVWCSLAFILGIVLGIVGLKRETEHKAPITVIGVVINILFLAFVIGMIVLGSFVT